MVARVEAGLAEIEAASERLRTIAPARRQPLISLINESTVPADWHAIAQALQVQLHRDFAPVWGTDGTIVVTTRLKADPLSWWLVILNDSDQAGALGYHDLSANGYPLGKVFAATDQKFNLSSSVTASHELLEMAADPYIDGLKGVLNVNGQPRIYACEVADPVEADNLGYAIGGVQVSDFVTPAWFHPGEPGPFSFRQNVQQALQLATGGYISWLSSFTQGWQQSTAALKPSLTTNGALASLIDAGGNPRLVPQPGSRRERRLRSGDLILSRHAA